MGCGNSTYTVSIAHMTDPTGLRVALIKKQQKQEVANNKLSEPNTSGFYWSIAGAERLSTHMADKISGKMVIAVGSSLDIFS
jgi:hypothetical protein